MVKKCPSQNNMGFFLNISQPTDEHFNLPRHELYHLKVGVLEKV